METGIEFLFHLVAMERILVVFLRINSKKVNERGCMQRFTIERGDPFFYRSLAKTSDEWHSRIHSIFVTDRRRSTVTDGECKDNTSKDPFSR